MLFIYFMTEVSRYCTLIYFIFLFLVLASISSDKEEIRSDDQLNGHLPTGSSSSSLSDLNSLTDLDSGNESSSSPDIDAQKRKNQMMKYQKLQHHNHAVEEATTQLYDTQFTMDN